MTRTVTMGVRRIDERVSIIDVKGDVTAACEAALMDAYQSASAPQTKAIVMNFTDLEYMNSGGIGLLVTLLVRANRQKQRIVAYGLSDHYRQIFELTRLDESFGIHEDESAAIAAARAGGER
ncbi:MAG TPA: STAS domain-containing protein [Candidatus Limnocylindria bacterium]